MYFLDLHELGKCLSLNSWDRLVIMYDSQKKQALPCDRRHEPVTSHPFTVQYAPWSGRNVTIPQLLSIIQWSFSIHRPFKTGMYTWFYFICSRGQVFSSRLEYHMVLPYDCILHTSKNSLTCRKRTANCHCWLLAQYQIINKTKQKNNNPGLETEFSFKMFPVLENYRLLSDL